MLNVVLADDELLTLAAIRTALEQSGLALSVIGEATSGLGIVDLCMHNQVDVVVTDIRMPHMDGISLMKTLREMRCPAKIIVLSAYRDFDYAQQAVNNGAYAYLLKPLRKEQLLDLLQDLCRQGGGVCGEHTVDRREMELVLAGFRGLTAEALPAGLWPILRGTYRVMLLQCGNDGGEEPFPRVLQSALEERVRFFSNICALPRDRRLALIFPDGTKTAFIAETVRDTAALRTELSVSLGVGGSAAGAEGLQEALAQAKQSLAAGFFSEDRVSLRLYEPDRQEAPADSRHLPGLEADLLAAVRDCAPEPALEALAQLRSCFAAGTGLSPRKVKRFYLNLLYSVRALPAGRTVDETAPELFEECMEAVARSDRLTAVHDHLAGLLGAVLGPAAGEDSLPKVRRIQQFCEQNYHRDISLEVVSGHVGLTGNYLCHLFKEHTGTGFWDYLTDLRIQKAKELLARGDCRANRVGQQVGYHNAGHFGRVFKSRVGMTP